MRILTLREYAEERGLSYEAVRRKVKKNELQTKYEIRHNKKVRVIITNEKQNDEFNNQVAQQNTIDVQQKQHTQTTQHNQVVQPENNDLVKLLVDMHKQNNELVANLQHYAQLAGQTKLLTDSENRTRDEYFRILQERNALEIKYNNFLGVEKDLKERLEWFKEVESKKKQVEEKVKNLESENIELQRKIEELQAQIKEIEANSSKEEKKRWKLPRFKVEF